MSPHDAEHLGLSDGVLAQIATTRGSAQAVVEIDDRLQPGHAALPNGFGLDLPTEDGDTTPASR
ncbi:molybdopterin dinucleotide binding domain-containing protein [Streptomyces sp. NPDC012474]|uniref:molybdopterin dinucleotide binding domain-containing protein n=1 Tax=Streptomyces sp. NPDC012474 TaxID=3364836 RepID=UPI0036E705D7